MLLFSVHFTQNQTPFLGAKPPAPARAAPAATVAAFAAASAPLAPPGAPVASWGLRRAVAAPEKEGGWETLALNKLQKKVSTKWIANDHLG